MRIIAIDIGYGHTKVVYKERGIKQFKFPSAISFCKKNSYGLDENEDCYELNNEKFRVGEDALIDAIDLRDPKLLVKYAPLFLAHAIKLTKINHKDFDVISTGISILNYKYKKDLEASLKDFTVNGERYKFKKVLINFQGQGVVFAEKMQDKNVLVIDGGYLTLDAIPFKMGKIVPEGAYATRLGVSKIVESVQAEVIEKTDIDYSLAEINEAVKVRNIKHEGEKIDLTGIVNEAVNNYSSTFKATIKSKMKDYLARVDKVIIAGGLAHLLKDADNMPKNIIYSKSAEFANTRGYFIIAGGVL